MTATRTANAHWEGSLLEGVGRVSLDSSNLGEYEVSWPARANEPDGVTSPEELIAAAHSACYSMSLAKLLTEAGSAPTSLDVRADVTFVPGTGITTSHLAVAGSAPGISDEDFVLLAAKAKDNCPVSKAMSGVQISVAASPA